MSSPVAAKARIPNVLIDPHSNEGRCSQVRARTCRSAISRRHIMARYGETAQSKVKKAMHERKQGTLRSGGSGKKVTSRKQAIAIGLSEARRAGGKVPAKRSSSGSS